MTDPWSRKWGVLYLFAFMILLIICGLHMLMIGYGI